MLIDRTAIRVYLFALRDVLRGFGAFAPTALVETSVRSLKQVLSAGFSVKTIRFVEHTAADLLSAATQDK